MLQRRESLVSGLAAVIVLLGRGVTPALAGPEAVSKLIDTLANARSFKVRVQAATVLARMKDPRAPQALARASASDPHPIVRVLSLRLLAKSAANDKSLSPQVRVTLNRALDDRDPGVRRQATASLAEMDARAAAAAARTRPRGATVVAVGHMGDRTGRASPAFRERLRAEIVSLLARDPRISVADKPTAAGVTFLVDGTISKLDFASGHEVEITCAVELVISRPPRGIMTIASGEAIVQKPKSFYKPAQREQMQQEALDNAVRSAHENVARFLASQ